jgi:diguanylate cyclase (GGDEF)-like protein
MGLKNARRTRAVGVILLSFALLGLGLALAGVYDDSPLIYAGFAAAAAFGLALSSRDGAGRVSLIGELIILGLAISWMFASVYSRAEVGFGLAEFVIGTLALALLRSIKPLAGVALFFGLSAAYALTLLLAGHFETQAAVNGLLFCSFALLLSWSGFNGEVLEMRNASLMAELGARNRDLSTLAMRDALTGLPNRRYFDQAFESLRRRGAEPGPEVSGPRPAALILGDIDYFKRLNDERGHQAGDAALKAVGDALGGALRADGVAMRIGGEEFAVIVEGADAAEARSVAERLAGCVRQRAGVTMSFGVASTDGDGADPDELYRRADAALYAAKRGGRDRVVVWDASLA